MTDNARIVREMVDRFLGWKLPAYFSPDCGIHYAPLPYPNGWPIGTNLLSAPQAQAMLEHVAGPAIAELTGAVDSINEILIKHQDALHDVRAELTSTKAELARARETLIEEVRIQCAIAADKERERIITVFNKPTSKGGIPFTVIGWSDKYPHTNGYFLDAEGLRAALAPEQKG